ncbi:hypothetical protein GCM10027290_65770 [Micromonospora sonneratiae]|uniref:Uncharacterized protein n=1 Tax=Micromonospora sonneratiae TaxID=1184706 RepID=A0ABW3YM71_9ACTN
MLEKAGQVAHETEAWATDSHSLRGWASNQAVLDRLVAQSQGDALTSSVHDPDEHGVGLLATAEVVMVGTVQENWSAGSEVYYNICVRFEVRRETTGPREITPVAVDCPQQVPTTRAPS